MAASAPIVLDSEIVVHLLHIGLEAGGRELVDDAPMFHDVVAIDKRGREINR
jgi:hypothetical protein